MPNSIDDAAQHARWMNEAIALARAGMRIHGGGPFGAVIVANGELVGRGCNQVTPMLDPTAHAEVTAIRDACRALQRFDLRGCDLYTSCEPCPMCLASAYWARISRIVYSNTRDDAAAIGFDDAFIYDEMPKDPTDRAIRMEHLPTPEASAAFAAWLIKTDKITY
jgi:guanine deaminase